MNAFCKCYSQIISNTCLYRCIDITYSYRSSLWYECQFSSEKYVCISSKFYRVFFGVTATKVFNVNATKLPNSLLLRHETCLYLSRHELRVIIRRDLLRNRGRYQFCRRPGILRGWGWVGEGGIYYAESLIKTCNKISERYDLTFLYMYITVKNNNWGGNNYSQSPSIINFKMKNFHCYSFC